MTGRPRDALHLFALSGFAVAQPLYDLFGDNPTFLVAHDLDGIGLVAFALGVLLVPPLVLFGVLELVRRFAPTRVDVARAAFVGALLALVVVPPIDHQADLPSLVWAVLALLVGAVGGLLYYKVHATQTFVGYTSPAPALFLVLFLLSSQVNPLVGGGDLVPVADVQLERSETPVVVVTFDEFTLGALLDQEGNLDSERYPGFARLADLSTWYPNAKSVSTHTELAVPAILSGSLRTGAPIPIASSYPRSLFTLLGNSHELHVSEEVTELCPETRCPDADADTDTTTLAEDVATVYLHSVLPEGAADRLLPPINTQWANFDEDDTGGDAPVPKNIPSDAADLYRFLRRAGAEFAGHNQLARFGEFLTSLGHGPSPGLWFHHSLLPHQPYEWFPSGQRYNGEALPAGFSKFGFWSADENVVHAAAQRFMVQTAFVDRLVDQLLDRLEVTGMLDDALLVVTADHGVSIRPRAQYRAVYGSNESENKHWVYPVPLFVKYPGQASGAVDDRDAQTIDILPTIADVLGADLPSGWDFDGVSLRGRERATRALRVAAGEDRLQRFDGPFDAGRVARDLATYLSPDAGEHDLFRLGPHGDLVGTTPEAAATQPAGRRAHADWARYDDVDLRGILPALLEPRVDGIEPGQWIAVSLNGTIAGVGPVYGSSSGAKAVVLLDPSYFRQGRNRIELFLVTDNGQGLAPIGQTR